MNLKRLVKIITDLMSREFYGKLTISFEHSRIVHVKKEESLK